MRYVSVWLDSEEGIKVWRVCRKSFAVGLILIEDLDGCCFVFA